MGVPIKEIAGQVNRRCNRIIIDAPCLEPQRVSQQYENATIVDGEVFKTVDTDRYEYTIPQIIGISINVNGKQITGADVLGFFLYFNDHREECLGIVS